MGLGSAGIIISAEISVTLHPVGGFPLFHLRAETGPLSEMLFLIWDGVLTLSVTYLCQNLLELIEQLYLLELKLKHSVTHSYFNYYMNKCTYKM
jgi:hypothetical protein